MKKIYIILPLLAAVVVASVFAVRWYADNRHPNFCGRHVLYVYPDMTAQQVLESLDTVVLRPGSLARTFRRMEVDTKLKPGKYLIEPSSPSAYVARMLNFGWQTPQNLVLSGTMRNKGRIAKKISTQMMVDSASVAQALDSSSFLASYGFTPENVFALFLPDTYQMYWTASIDDIFARMKKEYDAFWTSGRLEQAKALKLTPLQVSVVASIVSGETIKEFEYPMIAGVYLNRYRKGMRLQADPTVAYCFNYELDRVLKKHLSIDSPYNTYKYAGLPPAPINVPPKACIDAVLNPDRHGYLYFCASPEFDGTHRFALSYNDHLRNAKAFQRALTAKRKACGV